MIHFKDEDLKRLKESLNNDLPEFSTWAKSDLMVLRNLLARLEAAEKIVVSYAYHSVSSADFDAWRKLAGK